MNNERIVEGVKIYKTPQGEIIQLDENNINNCFKVLVEQNITRLDICNLFDYSYKKSDLEIFKKYNVTLDEIKISSAKIDDWTGLYYLKSLKNLNARWLDNVILDFSKIHGLESIWVDWHKKQTNLFNLLYLKELHLWKYKPNTKSLYEIEGLPNLVTLQLVQSNITNLKGIECIIHCKTLSLAYIKDLEINKDDFKTPLFSIENLDIESCKKVNLDFIKLFPNIRKLRFVNNGKLESLRLILDGLPFLEEIFIGETVIEESDNEYYRNYPNIKKFFFKEMRHHKLKLKDLGKW
jgi:hypothetical protein